MTLSRHELERYSRQIKLDKLGLAGQLKLKKARILCIGAGGLGSSLLLYLAAAGVGSLGIVDDDNLELSNLQRQVLYQETQVGHKKAALAKQRVLALNPHLKIQAYKERLNFQNAQALFRQYDLIADCSDNFATRYLINDVAYYLDKPYVFACVSKFEGQSSLFLGKKTPCLRWLFPTFPSADLFRSCEEGGVLGAVPGILGTLQATEIIKWILGLELPLAGTLLTLDLLTLQFRKLLLQQNSDCALCVHQTPLSSLIYSAPCPLAKEPSNYAISVSKLKELLQQKQDFLLLDVRTAEEHQIFSLGSRLLPLSQLAVRLKELNPKQAIVVYCQSGVRSVQALNLLLKAQFHSVSYLQGGLDEWQRAH